MEVVEIPWSLEYYAGKEFPHRLLQKLKVTHETKTTWVEEGTSLRARRTLSVNTRMMFRCSFQREGSTRNWEVQIVGLKFLTATTKRDWVWTLTRCFVVVSNEKEVHIVGLKFANNRNAKKTVNCNGGNAGISGHPEGSTPGDPGAGQLKQIHANAPGVGQRICYKCLGPWGWEGSEIFSKSHIFAHTI